jgi:hypothetical protein
MRAGGGNEVITEAAMDEHEDDLASEVIEGEEIERDAFDVEEEDIAEGEEPAEDEGEGPPEDDSEL